MLIKLFFVFIKFFLVSFVYASDNEQNINNEPIKKKILKFDLKSYNDNSVFNSNLELKHKLNDNNRILNKINNDFFLNKIDEKNVLISRLNIGYIELQNKKFGNISYGKNYGLIQDVFNINNITPSLINNINKHDTFMLNKSNNIITYRNNNFFGFINNLNFGLQYQIKNSTIPSNYYDKDFIECENGHGFGCLVSYNLVKNFKILASYFKSKRTNKQIEIDYNTKYSNKYAIAYAYGFKYINNNFHVSSLCSSSYFTVPYGKINNIYIRRIFKDKSALRKYYYCGYAEKCNTLELVSKYKFNKYKISPFIGYIHTIFENIKENNEFINKFIGIGLIYEPNKNISSSIDYKINLLKSNNFIKELEVNTNNIISMGISLKF